MRRKTDILRLFHPGESQSSFGKFPSLAMPLTHLLYNAKTMARKKRSSRILEKAKRRLDGLQSIDSKLSLSNGRSVVSYHKNIDALRDKISTYNQTLATADALQTEVSEAERELAHLSELVLIDVASKFGNDSAEYEKAGGVRKSDRKRPARRLATAV